MTTIAPKERMRICDPTAGSGGMLIECAHYLERHKQSTGSTKASSMHAEKRHTCICLALRRR